MTAFTAADVVVGATITVREDRGDTHYKQTFTSHGVVTELHRTGTWASPGATHLRVRHEGGWGLRGNVASRATFWRDDENYITADMVGGRVLVIDYPSDDHAKYAQPENCGSDALIAKALVAESEARS